MEKKMFKLYVFVLVPQLISDKSTAKGKLTGECILYWIRMSCKAIDFSCSYTGEKKRKIRRNGWILKYKIPFWQCLICTLLMATCINVCFPFAIQNLTFFACCWKHQQLSIIQLKYKTLPMYWWSNFIWVIQCWNISTVYFL